MLSNLETASKREGGKGASGIRVITKSRTETPASFYSAVLKATIFRLTNSKIAVLFLIALNVVIAAVKAPSLTFLRACYTIFPFRDLLLELYRVSAATRPICLSSIRGYLS